MRLPRVIIFLSLVLIGCGRSPAVQPPGGPRILIISIDGLRPDVLLRSTAPNIRALMRNGSFTFYARTTDLALTLPTHVSMLTGVRPEKHHVLWDMDRDTSGPYFHYAQAATLFELARKAGYSTAMAAGKSKFIALAKPGTIDWQFLPERDCRDEQVTAAAVKIIEEHRPQVMFVHLPSDDYTGHSRGWGSPEQIQTTNAADQCVGQLLAALRRQNLMQSTTVIVTADHGGMSYTHGGTDVRCRLIPWIISGPGIKKNLDLTSEYYLEVRVEDTFATACCILRGAAQGD